MKRLDFFCSWRYFGFGVELCTPEKDTANGHKSALNIMLGPFRAVFWIGKRQGRS